MLSDGFSEQEILDSFTRVESNEFYMKEEFGTNLKSGPELFQDNLNRIRNGVDEEGEPLKQPKPSRLPFVGGQSYTADSVAPVKIERPKTEFMEDQGDFNIRQHQIKLQAGKKALKAKVMGPDGETPKKFDPQADVIKKPEDVFSKKSAELAGTTRKDLDTMAEALGIRGAGNLKDKALRFRIASRQAANTNTPAEASSG